MEMALRRTYIIAAVAVALLFFVANNSYASLGFYPVNRLLNELEATIYQLPEWIKILLIITGIVSLIAGALIYKYLVMLPGALIGCIVGYAIGKSSSGDLTGIVMALLGMVVGGVIAWFIHQIVIWLIGALMGSLVCVAISYGFFDTAPNILALIISVLFGGSLLLILSKEYVVVLTSLMGSIFLMVGTGKIYNGAMLIGLTVLGIVIQHASGSLLRSRGILTASAGDDGAKPADREHVDIVSLLRKVRMPAILPTNTQYASFLNRLAAFLIDSVVLSAGFYFVARLISIISGIRAFEEKTAYKVMLVAAGWLYWSVLESSRWQATPGKMALSISVLDYQGNRVSFAKATVRHFGKFLSAMPLFAGYLPVFFTKTRQALHDMIATCLMAKNAGVEEKSDRRLAQDKIVVAILSLVGAALNMLFPFTYLVSRQINVKGELIFPTVISTFYGFFIHLAGITLLLYCGYKFFKNATVSRPLYWISVSWVAANVINYLMVLTRSANFANNKMLAMSLQHALIFLSFFGVTLYYLITRNRQLTHPSSWKLPVAIEKNKKIVVAIAGVAVLCIAGGLFAINFSRDRSSSKFKIDPLGNGTSIMVAQSFSNKNEGEYAIKFTFKGNAADITHEDRCYPGSNNDPKACLAQVIKIGKAEALKYWTDTSPHGDESNVILLYNPERNKAWPIPVGGGWETITIAENKHILLLSRGSAILPRSSGFRPLLYYGYLIEYAGSGINLTELPAINDKSFNRSWCEYMYKRQMDELQSSVLETTQFDQNESRVMSQQIHSFTNKVEMLCSGDRQVSTIQFTEKEAEEFIQKWLKSSEENTQFNSVMGMYADEVVFYKLGKVSRAVIKDDKRKYFDRWPVRKYEIKKPISVLPGPNLNEKRTNFEFQFALKNPKKAIKGIGTNEIVLRKVNDIIYIVSEKGETKK